MTLLERPLIALARCQVPNYQTVRPNAGEIDTGLRGLMSLAVMDENIGRAIVITGDQIAGFGGKNHIAAIGAESGKFGSKAVGITLCPVGSDTDPSCFAGKAIANGHAQQQG